MIGSWLAYTVALSAFIALLAAVIEPLIRSRGWRVRPLWSVALLGAVVLPAALALRPGAPPLLASPLEAGPSLAIAEASIDLDRPVGVIWVPASALLLILVGGGLLQLRRAVDRARRIQIDGTPVALTDRLGPGATPFGEPRILVPDWVRALPQPAQRLLVLHEREHLAARDPEWLLGGWLVIALTPWNPAGWWMLSRLTRAIEMDCDARVLSRTPVKPYGELLLEVADRVARPPLVGMLTFTRSRSELGERIDQMTLPRRPLGLARQLTLASVATLAVVAACEMPAPDPVGPTASSTVVPTAVAKKLIAAQPTVVVLSSTGTELYRARGVPSLRPETISSIEVIKGHEMADDRIQVTLKQDAAFDTEAAKVSLHLIKEAKERLEAKRQVETGMERDAPFSVLRESAADGSGDQQLRLHKRQAEADARTAAERRRGRPGAPEGES